MFSMKLRDDRIYVNCITYHSYPKITEFIFDQCTELHVVSTVTKSKFSVKTKRLIKCALDRQVDVFYHKLEPDKHEPNS